MASSITLCSPASSSSSSSSQNFYGAFYKVWFGPVASPASGHVGTCPPGVSEIFFPLGYTLSGLHGLVLCQYLNLAPFVQPYSLCNNTITGYNGASAKVNVVFTARRYALARSLLSAGVCSPRSRIVSRWLKISSNMFFGPAVPSFFSFFLTPSANTQF